MIGRVLGGRYEIISEVGSGGMAIVYKAKCRLLNRFVALKILKDQYREDKEFVARFIRESQAAASLSNPNIVSVFDVGNDGDINYIVMELVEGITLKDYIEKNGMLNWRLALKFSMQICSALADAHRNGIIHRDIKPHNVIVTPAGNCKVADFGIACSTSNINETKKVDEGILGSVHYISPEHAKGVIPDERSDIYSLGITMYEMLTGRLPFDGESAIAIAVKHLNETPVPIKDINIAVPLNVVNIVNKAIAKKNDERYQSAKEMYDDMEAMAQEPDSNSDSGAEIVTPLNGGTVRFGKEDIEEIKKQTEEKTEEDKLPEENTEEPKEELKEEEKEEKKKSFFGKLFEVRNSGDKKAVVFALITSAVLILTVLLVSLSIFVPSFGIGALFTRSGSEMEMPSLVGEQMEEMQEQYKKEMDFVIEEIFDNEFEKGEIISHEPLAGMNVKTPVKVVVQVSKGAKEVKMPNLVGKSSADAIKMLKKEGLKYKEEEIFDESAEAGIVVKQSPIDGTTVKTGDVVTITISKGEDEEMTVMPALVGKTEAEARILVDDAELKVAIVKKDSDKPKNQVIEQNFPEGTELSKNTVVTIIVSTGTAEKKEDDNKKNESGDEPAKNSDPVNPSAGDTPSGNGGNNENNPPQSKSYNLNISLPSNKEKVSIIVKQGGTTVYDKTVSTSQGTLTVTLYGMGTSNVEVYQDGLLVRTQKVTF